MNVWLLLLHLTISILQPSSPQAPALPDEIAVCEAIVLAHLDRRSAESKKTLTYYFDVSSPHDYVSFPDIFFEKYKGHIPVFRRSTELVGRPSAAWTPEWSWTFKTPERVDDETYTVWGGYYCGGQCASHCDYRVVRERGRWIVQSRGTCEAL